VRRISVWHIYLKAKTSKCETCLYSKENIEIFKEYIATLLNPKPELFEGLKIPKHNEIDLAGSVLRDIQNDFCNKSGTLCSTGIDCESCLFASSNAERFEKWLMQKLK